LAARQKTLPKQLGARSLTFTLFFSKPVAHHGSPC
jgi:hypothetical protein